MSSLHKSISTLFAFAVATTTIFAAPAITDVTAQQRYPWNGKVDIAYTVSGDIAATAKEQGLITSLKVTATDRKTGTSYTATSLSGDTGLANGTHKIVWDMSAQGLSLKSTNVVFTVSCESTPATYCVIDLSGGTNATSYPITYLAAPPSGGFNVNAYKTTKLVLKRMEAGTFIMGSDQTDTSHRVTLTKPFYLGLFEMTQKQYSLVMGQHTSYHPGNKKPVENLSYNTIRGSTNGAQWPKSNAVDSDSFMGKLRARTALNFDLPTEAQWEYACRAGTTTTWSFGDSFNGDYMWYIGNSTAGSNESSTQEVGTKLPNPWGLYDMHGNVREECLDWYKTLSYGTDPKGSSSSSPANSRVNRGGCFTSGGGECSSYSRNYDSPSATRSMRGFRLARTLTTNAQGGPLCSGSNAPTNIDLSTGTRTAALTETIRYSTAWETTASGATAVVEVNGETLSSATGSGATVWQPTRNGTYTLTHKVMDGETQVGTIQTATFEVSHFPAYTETQTTPEPVPYVWLRGYFPEIADEYEVYEAAALATSANGVNKVWECYVAGLVPTNAAARFEARIAIGADGNPQISWNPDLNENGTKTERIYTVEGKAELPDAWGPTNTSSRFFHVKVGMPE